LSRNSRIRRKKWKRLIMRFKIWERRLPKWLTNKLEFKMEKKLYKNVESGLKWSK